METVIRPARELPRDEIWNLLGSARHLLGLRGEILPPSWVDDTADAVAHGLGTAWYTGGSRSVGALGILWVREGKGYGHLHAANGDASVAELTSLGRHLAGRLPPEVGRLDMGATGLSEAGERAVGKALAEDLRFSTLLRHSMVRPLENSAPPPDPRWPAGVELTTVRKVPFDELTTLDWRTYRGTPDETLLSGTREGNRELLSNALAGLFGRFLDDASPAVSDRSGKLTGFAVGCQESLRTGILLDLAVDPAHRREGLGRALVLRSLRAMLALGYARAHLWVTDGNVPARTLYEKVGFSVDATAAIFRWVRPSP